ncbi:PilZ domain-containing protein [Sphingomonas koreensis]|nr:PilZ domain-containing protein [Sphingomonas koreensis]
MSVQQEARRERRTQVFFPVMILCIEHGSRRAHVLDLSSHGARLHSDAPLRLGQPLLIDLYGAKHSARVIWAREKQAGVSFTRGLSVDELEAVDAAHTTSLTNAANRLGIRLSNRLTEGPNAPSIADPQTVACRSPSDAAARSRLRTRAV